MSNKGRAKKELMGLSNEGVKKPEQPKMPKSKKAKKKTK
jgi:hypothetical protein